MDHVHSSSIVLRVFLSSTLVDLQAHRAAVRDIVGRLGQFTLAMEQFGAREGDAQTVSTDLVAISDLYLGVIAWRYGYVPKGQERSVTHQEYEEAGRLGIPRLVFLAASETQAADDANDLFPTATRDPEHLDQLLTFRTEIEQAQVVDYFTTPDDLAKKVAAALHQYLQAHPAEQGPRPPRDLPPRAPGFVGREQDLQAVCSSLCQGQAVAIVGMGGLGKSSLTAEALHALAAEPDSFLGGITWVRCDERTGLEGLIWTLDQLLAAWGASLPPDAVARVATPEDGLALRERALRQRLRPDLAAQPATALVLLDNVESGLPLDQLLAAVQPLGVTVVCTLRSEPSTARVRLLRLETLSAAAAVTLYAQRFADRGGQWDGARDAAATTAIVQALGGLPLAIELAAARAARTQMSLATLAEELRGQDALARLADPLNASASVRYSLGRTLAVLSPTQRVRFAALGLPAGPDWPLPVIERLLAGVPTDGAGDVAAQADLEALVAYSLVGLARSGEGNAVPRVRLHPVVRDLAHDELRDQPDTVQLAALVGLMAGVHAWVVEQRTTSAVLARDADLIAGTVRAAAARQVELPLLIATVTAFDVYLFSHDFPLREELVRLQLASARTIGDQKSELISLHRLMSTFAFEGRQEERYGLAREAVDVARALGDAKELASALGASSAAAHDAGRFDEALALYTEAHRIATTLQPGPGMAGVFTNLADAAAKLGKLQEAAQLFAQALQSAQVGRVHPITLVILYHNYGDVSSLLHDYAAARRYHTAVVELMRAFQSGSEATDLENLGEIALKTGDLEAAFRLFHEALQLFEAWPVSYAMRVDQMLAHVRGNLAATAGEAARLRGDTEEARRHFAEALTIFEASGLPYNHYARDYEDFVRERMALLTAPRTTDSSSQAEEASAVAVATAGGAALARARRRWWPWGRR
jgi:tetratricopeptide (TPR) repeat protein